MIQYGTLEEARAARGLRLVVAAGNPSPWSEAAKGCFDAKGIDYLGVRLRPRDADVRAWTGHHNAPVALYDDEPPRTGWADILALAERIRPDVPLVPETTDDRVALFGMAHEILSEGGLIWSARLVLIHAGLTSDGQRGFPTRAAQYLGAKYGYAADRIDGARRRVLSTLAALGDRLPAGRRYFLGDRLTALDIYAAAATGVFAPLPEAACATQPEMRRAYETMDDDIRAAIPPVLLGHRDFVYAQHLVLPVRL